MYKPAKSSLQGRTIDILNIIRNNASMEYQNDIPAISDVADIPAVGQVIMGNPARSNEFINALINRIALVVAKSATFANPYEMLKKGYLEYGESVEDVFIELAKVVEYSAEKGAAREFKRTVPEVHSAFHLLNWKVLYPVTIERETLKKAFLSPDGVENMIIRIIDSIYTAAAYDEFLLFKYLLIKNTANGHIKPEAIDVTDMKKTAAAFRGVSNSFTFLSKNYNFAGVRNSAPKERQYIFMDSKFNAEFDVEVLSAAFNMDKADFMGRLLLIDDFTTFDHERWAVIRENSDMVEDVTAEDLRKMQAVKAILVDEEFFQIYDELSEMEDTKVSAGLYWNYFYHNWKIVSVSPFANAAAFVNAETGPALALAFKVKDMIQTDEATMYELEQTGAQLIGKDRRFKFLQTQALTSAGIAIDPYGIITVPNNTTETELELHVSVGDTGVIYAGGLDLTAVTLDTEIEFNTPV